MRFQKEEIQEPVWPSTKTWLHSARCVPGTANNPGRVPSVSWVQGAGKWSLGKRETDFKSSQLREVMLLYEFKKEKKKKQTKQGLVCSRTDFLGARGIEMESPIPMSRKCASEPRLHKSMSNFTSSSQIPILTCILFLKFELTILISRIVLGLCPCLLNLENSPLLPKLLLLSFIAFGASYTE